MGEKKKASSTRTFDRQIKSPAVFSVLFSQIKFWLADKQKSKKMGSLSFLGEKKKKKKKKKKMLPVGVANL